MTLRFFGRYIPGKLRCSKGVYWVSLRGKACLHDLTPPPAYPGVWLWESPSLLAHDWRQDPRGRVAWGRWWGWILHHLRSQNNLGCNRTGGNVLLSVCAQWEHGKQHDQSATVSHSVLWTTQEHKDRKEQTQIHHWHMFHHREQDFSHVVWTDDGLY